MAGNLLRRIERLESIDGAHGVRDAELQAAEAVLAEPDAWSRDYQRAQQAFATRVQYFGLTYLLRKANDIEQASRRSSHPSVEVFGASHGTEDDRR